ncbi:PAS domain S-box protein [Noviherbaspirillum sp. 1P10PC]|uniref:sensor domain-containing protein n=1 Tax=Noviherbaspirillum sp. 1P10PC TaxID=3132292 RepID=UPI0039A38DCE
MSLCDSEDGFPQDSLLTLAFHTSPIGKALFTLAGTWLYANEAFLKLLGLSKEKLSGMSLQQILRGNASDVNLLQEVSTSLQTSCRIGALHIREDRAAVWVDVLVTLARDSGGTPTSLVVEVIHTTEETDRRSYQDLFFNLSPELLAIADRRGFFVEVSPAWTDLLGWSRSELTSIQYIEFVHPDDRLRTLAEAKNLHEHNSIIGFRNRYRHKDGRYRWLEWGVPKLLDDHSFCIARDVTHGVEAEAARTLQEDKIRLLIENGSDAFIGMSQDGKITEWNRQAEYMLGWTAQEALGAEMSTLIAPVRYRAQHDQGISRFLTTGKAHIVNKRVELPVLTKSGSELLVEMTVGAIKHGDGYYFATFMRDISHQKAVEAQLHYQATRDFLTALPNRYEFMSRLEAAICREARTGKDQHVVLLFIDLDGFKEVNDRLGHNAGDEVLRTFAQRLQHLVRDGIDTVARLAGDEFVILLEDVSFERAEQVARAALSAGSDEFLAVQGECALSASIGVVFHTLSETGEQLLSRADAVMYASKKAGKNRAILDSGDRKLELSRV